MKSRRQFLGASSLLLGRKLIEALATPLRQWTRPLLVNTELLRAERLRAAPVPRPPNGSPVTFVDVAKEAGVTAPNVWGGVEHKNYIIEAKGSGPAVFEYRQDRWLGFHPAHGQPPEET